MAAALIGAIFLFGIILLVVGLIGLSFKSNREDKEYVSGVKSLGWIMLKQFVLIPAGCLVVLVIMAFMIFSR